MILIFAGSSDALSAEHTSRFLIPFLRWLDPNMAVSTMFMIHAVVRKLGHFTEYAILAALLWRALRGTFPALPGWVFAASAFLIAATFAASDEFHQSFVATRTSSPYDVLIDCFGAAFAVAVCLLVTRVRAPAVRA